MPGVREQVRTSLEVGFASRDLPPRFASLRGIANRAIPLLPEFPFDDAQFEVVLMDGAAVSRASVKEANRVLKPEGRLCFTVCERGRGQDGYALPDIYAIVRDGFHIIGVERPPWWKFGLGGRTITIVARKKAWRSPPGLVHGVIASPLRSRR